jgi:TolA-binding protein
MGFLSRLFGKTSEESELDAAKAEREKFLANAETDEVSDAINAASGLLLDRKYAESIAAYLQIIEKYPQERGKAESQIGAAQYFLGQFTEAIESYAAAREHGADPSMMDDNIWEACEALVKKGDKAAAQRYLALCPDGSYVKKAQKALA